MSPRQRRLIVDVLPSVVLSGVVIELRDTGAPFWQWVVALSLAWSLVARRYVPRTVFAVVAVLGAVCIIGDFGIVAASGAFVALHAVAWRRPLRETVVAAGLVGAAAVLAAFGLAPPESLDDAFELICGIALLSVLLGITQQNQERALRALEERTAELEERTAELEAERERSARMAATQERQRIAREIHDIVAHSVSVMIALSEGAARAPEERARRTMREVAGTGRAALADLRSVLAVLRTADDEADGGGRERAGQDDRTSAAPRSRSDAEVTSGRADTLPTLPVASPARSDQEATTEPGFGSERKLAEDLARASRRPVAPQPQIAQIASLTQDVQRAGLQVDYDLIGSPDQLPGGLQATVFRIVQESLTNTLKHAPDATRAQVLVRVGPADVLVEVGDDGGPRASAAPLSSGHGLLGMAERANAFGGTVDVGPAPAGGWLVRCRLPVPARERAS